MEDALILTGTNVEDDGKIMVEIRQEYTTYDGVFSVIVPVSDALKKGMILYIEGSKSLNNLENQKLGLEMGEGKEPMSRCVYKHICQILL